MSQKGIPLEWGDAQEAGVHWLKELGVSSAAVHPDFTRDFVILTSSRCKRSAPTLCVERQRITKSRVKSGCTSSGADTRLLQPNDACSCASPLQRVYPSATSAQAFSQLAENVTQSGVIVCTTRQMTSLRSGLSGRGHSVTARILSGSGRFPQRTLHARDRSSARIEMTL